MNQTQFDKLKPLEKFLEQSTHDYLVNQPMANKKVVFDIAEELGMKTGSITCSSCVLKAFKRVAEQFFAFKSKIETKKSEPAEPAEPTEPAEPAEPAEPNEPTKKSKSKSPKSND